MTPEEAIKYLKITKTCAGDDHKGYLVKEMCNVAIAALKEIQQYREIGTVEQVKNQKENLNVAYQIISDYEQYGTVEEFKMAQRYMRLVNAHGTIGQVIDSCAEYEEIGTAEECQEAREKQIPKKPKKVTNSGVRYTDEYVCPNCEQHFTGTGIAEYCYHCGQAIDWNENLGEMGDEQP